MKALGLIAEPLNLNRITKPNPESGPLFCQTLKQIPCKLKNPRPETLSPKPKPYAPFSTFCCWETLYPLVEREFGLLGPSHPITSEV